jgi:hypothetical protein
MPMLEEIGTILSTQSIASSSGVGGWLLALSIMPDSTAIQDRVVSIAQTAGGPSLATVELDESAFQVRVRGTVYDWTAAEAKAIEVYQALHGLTPGTYSGRHYAGVWAQQPPFLLEYDDSNRPHLVNNYRALRSRT